MAAYCRVSTDEEEQLSSLENQVTYYTEFITNNPKYELVDVYADEGISGTSTRHRDDFQRMIADCEAGKIDLIITKSISRFARNTQDCLNYSRKLKDLGIGVQFEKENINTMDSTGELLFTILSSLAQDESRSISENTTWGIRALFKQGVLHLNANRFFGYDKDSKGHLVINPTQGSIVQRIYHEFMDGVNPDVIAKRLNDEGVPGCSGKAQWRVSTVMSVLKNEKHMGDAILQKTYTADFLTKRMEENKGHLEQYYIKDDHDALIDKELWKATQQEIERRRQYMETHGIRTMGRYTDTQPFSNRVFCGVCGNVYWRRTFTRLNTKMIIWQCGNRYKEKGTVGCKSDNLREADLHKAFIMAWNAMLENREEYLPKWQEQSKSDNPLVAFRANQFMAGTAKAEPMIDLDCSLVGKVFDYCVVQPLGIINFYFLDGTSIGIATKE